MRLFGDHTPICPVCGAFLAKPKKHKRWHGGGKPTPKKAKASKKSTARK